jgi:hypothetical protein
VEGSGSVVGVDVGVVAVARGVVGGTGVGSGMAKRTCFGGFVAVATTLRSGRLLLSGGVGVGVGVSITLRGWSQEGGGGGADAGTAPFGLVAVACEQFGEVLQSGDMAFG